MSDLSALAPSYAGLSSLMMEQFKNSTKLHAIVRILSEQSDELEAAGLDVSTCLSLATSTGDQLDIVGSAFATDRQSRTDEDFRKAIYARIALNGFGTVPEILDACRKVFDPIEIEYVPEYPGKYFVTLPGATGNTSNANAFLAKISPAGVQAMHGTELVTATNPEPILSTSTGERILVVKQDSV